MGNNMREMVIMDFQSVKQLTNNKNRPKIILFCSLRHLYQKEEINLKYLLTNSKYGGSQGIVCNKYVFIWSWEIWKSQTKSMKLAQACWIFIPIYWNEYIFVYILPTVWRSTIYLVGKLSFFALLWAHFGKKSKWYLIIWYFEYTKLIIP